MEKIPEISVSLEDFIKKIQTEAEYQKLWFRITYRLKQGKVLYFSDNIKKRVGYLGTNPEMKDLHPISKNLYDFLIQNENYIRILLEIQGFYLVRFSHRLYQHPQYQFGYHVKKDFEKEENKFIIKESNLLGPVEAFILGLLAVKTNLGQMFYPRDEFIKNLVEDSANFCQCDFADQGLRLLMDINIDAKTDQYYKVLGERIENILKNLEAIGFIDRILIQFNQVLISISPGAFLWNALLDQANEQTEV